MKARIAAEPRVSEIRKVADAVEFPGTLNVLGKHWPVEWVVDTDDFSDQTDSYGECIFTKQLIRVKNGLPFDCERDTLIHETFHAIDHELQLGLKEKQVHRLACAFYAVMRSNPDFVAHIMTPHPEEA